MLKSQFLVATDLDGTLLDHYNYSWSAAAPALTELARHDIPVVINTSKTLQEVFRLQQALSISDPFIVENGSAIFIYADDQRFRQDDLTEAIISVDNAELNDSNLRQYVLGKPVAEILQVLDRARIQHNWSFCGFSDMSIEQLIELTALPLKSANAAKERQFSEPLVWQDSDENLSLFKQFLLDNDLGLLKGGRFYHVLGQSNKGLAIQWLQNKRTCTDPYTIIALGDSDNDLEMLRIADHSVLVKSPTHTYPELQHPQKFETSGEGPAGWNEAIQKITGLGQF